MSRTILYLCYGPQAIYDQTAFSVLSALRFGLAGARLAIYCDRPEVFAGLAVECVALDAAKLDAWMGGSDYIHRRKSCAIMDALDRFGGKVAFIDSDTYFLASPSRLFERIGHGRTLLHICEGFLHSTGTPFDTALAKQLVAHPLKQPSGESVVIDARTRMWNTGVVGVDAADIACMHEALALSDIIWATADPQGPYGRKIHHAEQFATGYAFRGTRISEASDIVYHYWPAPAKAVFGVKLDTLAAAGLADPSPATLERIYHARYRATGSAALRESGKMTVRRLALMVGIALPGVRRSV